MYKYEECGLDNIFLKNGYSMVETPWGQAVAVDNAEGLHLAIGMCLVNSADPLTGQEFRFLRKELGLSQKRFGALLEYSDQSVAGWEKGRSPLPRAVDVVIRALYRESVEGESHLSKILHSLNELDRKHYEGKQEKISLREQNGTWFCDTAA